MKTILRLRLVEKQELRPELNINVFIKENLIVTDENKRTVD